MIKATAQSTGNPWKKTEASSAASQTAGRGRLQGVRRLDSPRAAPRPHVGPRLVWAGNVSPLAEGRSPQAWLSRPAPAPQPDRPPHEPIPGETAALEATAAAGLRAANWLRSLPGPATGNWIAGDLADAVQEATGGLDPADCADADQWGEAGVPGPLRDRLDIAFSLPHVEWLSPAHKAAVLAITGCVLGMPKIVANDPVAAVEEELAAMRAILDSAYLHQSGPGAA